MGARQRTPLVLGAGLDRASGVMAADPRAMRDARNVYLLGGKVQARRGMTARGGYYDDTGALVSHVLAACALRAYGEMVVVGYSQASGKVWVYRCTAAGKVVARFATPWFTLAAGSEPPVVVACAIDQRVFLAHDEPVLGRRAATVYYEPALLPGSALPVLAYPGGEPMKFRGVTAHLNYLVGWGFGTPAEDRPEFVRVSKPAAPLEFEAEDYWIVGMIGDAVTCCASVDSTLVAFKLTQTYQLFGDNARNFGSLPFPTDATHGCAGSRLATVYNGHAYFWSLAGPRRTDGRGPSTDLALPLDLLGPSPEGLVAAGAARLAFGVHHANEGVLLWIFGRRGYALSLLEDPLHLRWSYLHLGKAAYCAAHAFAFADGNGGGTPDGGGGGVDPPPDPGDPPPDPADPIDGGTLGGASVRPLALDPAAGYGALGLKLENRATSGVDFIEVFFRKDGDAAFTALPRFANTGGQQQTLKLGNLEPGARYTVAVRLYRGGKYQTTHKASDPMAWPAYARAEGAVCGTPAVGEVTWRYEPGYAFITPARHALTIKAAAAAADVPVELLVNDGAETKVLEATGGAVTLDALWPEQYETTRRVQARHRFADGSTSPLSAEVVAYFGPQGMPPQVVALSSPASGQLTVQVAAPGPSVPMAVWHYGTHPVNGAWGWWPLGEPGGLAGMSIVPAPFLQPGETERTYTVPRLAGKDVSIRLRAGVVLPTGAGELPPGEAYGAYGLSEYEAPEVSILP